MNIEELLDRTVFGNPVPTWAAAAAVAVVASVVLLAVRAAFRRGAAKYGERREDDLVAVAAANLRPTLLVAIAVLASTYLIDLSMTAEEIARGLLIVLVVVQIAQVTTAMASFWITHTSAARKEQDPAQASAYGIISFFVKLAIWSVAVLLVLDNLGFDISTLIAGLGIGGVAIALAVQSIVSDVFCSVAILMDKPFEVGDFLIVGDYLGTVERIGVKTTRLRSLSGEQIVLSNADLVGSRVRNYKRMNERRVLFGFGAVYQTSADTLEKIPGWVRAIIEAQETARFDRAHFQGFGASSLDFEVVYYVLDRDYNLYMDVQERINLAIARKLEAEGVEFAYPTQTLYVKEEGVTE